MRPGKRPADAWSFLPPYREKPLPEKYQAPKTGNPFPDRTPPAFRLAAQRSGNVPPATPDNPPDHTILARGTWQTLRDWSLVLASQDIPCVFEQSKEGPWFLQVQNNHVEVAARQIRLYREENPEKPAHAPLPPLRWSLQPLWVLLIPIIFTFWQSGLLGNHGHHYRQGVAIAERITAGEWWRTFTALTLHANSSHLVSNLLSGFLVLALLAARLPLTRIVPLLVLAAGAANLAVAFTISKDFSSLGFSTFVFAALGALGTLEWRLRPEGQQGLLRRFAPCLGVFVLTVFMGLGENADILAHFYGLAAGLVTGLLPSRRQLQWGMPIRFRDVWIVAAVYSFFLLVWIRALH